MNKEFGAAKANIGRTPVRENVPIMLKPDKEVEEVQAEFEHRASPKERFKDMETKEQALEADLKEAEAKGLVVPEVVEE